MPETPPSEADSRAREVAGALTTRQRRDLEDYPNVIGTAVGPRVVDGEQTDDVGLIVYVTEKVDETTLPQSDRIPASVTIGEGRGDAITRAPSGDRRRDDSAGRDEGRGAPNTPGESDAGRSRGHTREDATISTDVREVGIWSVDAGSPIRKERIRPVVGGIEVGTAAGTGTITALFHDRDGNERALTARHIIAEGSSGSLGRSLDQPTDGDSIGEVVATHEFSTSGTKRNIVDTVLIEPSDDVTIRGQYLGYREAVDTGRASIGDRVVTFSAGGMGAGTVLARDVDVLIKLPDGETARYTGLVEYGWEGANAASGAAVGRITTSGRREMSIVGQHVGSSTDSALLIPWVHIERQFGTHIPDSDRYPEFGPVGTGDGTVTIRVEDSSGNPVEGATVTVEQLGALTASATIRVEDSSGTPIEGATVDVESE